MLLCPCGFPGKNTGVGLLFSFPGDLPDQGSNLRLLHWQVESLQPSHQGSPDSVIDIFFFIMVYYRILNIILCAILLDLVVYPSRV